MRRHRSGGRRGVAAAAATAATVVLASPLTACSLGSDSEAAPAPPPGLRIPSDLGEACGERSATDPADVAADRVVARCAPGAPEPAPLPLPVTVRVGLRAPTEELAPVLLADRLGAFEEENLTVELVELDDPAELYAALAAGQLDAVAGELDAPFFDAVHEGSGARLVLGGAVAPAADDVSVPQPGFWVRADALSRPGRWSDLRGQRVAVEDGISDVAAYPIGALVRQDDMRIDDLHLVPADGATAVEALRDHSVVGAWLPEPHWRGAAGRSGLRLVATLPPESLSGVVLAERLVDPARDREVGVAFARAVIRTINTHLADDYQADDDVVAALADATGQRRREIRATPPWVFDWEIRQGTTDRLQRPLVEVGGVIYEEELPESRLVDRSVHRSAVSG